MNRYTLLEFLFPSLVSVASIAAALWEPRPRRSCPDGELCRHGCDLLAERRREPGYCWRRDEARQLHPERPS